MHLHQNMGCACPTIKTGKPEASELKLKKWAKKTNIIPTCKPYLIGYGPRYYGHLFKHVF